MSSRFFIAALASVSALSLASPAFAQDQEAAVENEGLGEIIVTAQRRAESLQRAALAVSAVGGEQLQNAGVTETEGLATLVPSLQVQPAGGPGINFYLRGVGTQSGNSFGENAIAFSFDGVFIARPTATVGSYFDLQRVEVLKGPQGTLYGRNATGGAVNVLPRRPELGQFGGDFNASFGNYDAQTYSGALNFPIGEDAALRIAGQSVRRDGYLSDGYQDEESDAVRVSFLVEPTPDWSIAIVGDYFNQGGMGSGSVLLSDPTLGIVAPPLEDRIGASDPRSLAALSAYVATLGGPPFCGGFGNLINSGCVGVAGNDGFLDNEYWGLSATIERDLGAGTLTIVPAHRETNTNFRFYVPGFRADIQEHAVQSSLEARFASDLSGPLNYVVGAFYFQESQDAQNAFYLGRLSHSRTTPNLDTVSQAVFGQATLSVTDSFRIVAGVRYTDESREQETSALAGGVPGLSWPPGGPYPALPAPFAGDLDFQETTWKAGIEWDAAPDSLVYANVATGFKAGGFFAAAPPNNTYDPEQLTAYTIGSKNRFFNNTLQFNVEAFYWEYEDQQIGFVGGILGQNGVFTSGGIVLNAGHATMQGVELDIQWAPTANDIVSANVLYLDGSYDELVYDAFSNNATQPPTGCNVLGSTLANPTIPGNQARFFRFDCSGRSTINSPEWTLNLAYEHTFNLGDMDLVAGLNTRIEDSRVLSIRFQPTDEQDSYMMSNAFLTLEHPTAGWSITGFVNNIEDEAVFAGTYNKPIVNATYGVLRPPRIYGVRLGYEF